MDQQSGGKRGRRANCNVGAGSITYPGKLTQVALYRRVLRQAAMHPRDVSVVEMHGIGTQTGDRVEMTAVQSVFASEAASRRPQPLVVGAVKANIGQGKATAGLTLIKSILIPQHNTTPSSPVNLPHSTRNSPTAGRGRVTERPLATSSGQRELLTTRRAVLRPPVTLIVAP